MKVKRYGLPASELFKHLPKAPVGKVTHKFLEDYAWWWRNRANILELWLSEDLGPAEAAIIRGELDRNPSAMDAAVEEKLMQWWDQESDAALAYEMQSRIDGKYPCGEAYIRLRKELRNSWIGGNWKLNLDAAAITWTDDEEPDVDPEKWTTKIRFNLRAPDGLLKARFQDFLNKERARLLIPKPSHEGENRRGLGRSFAAVENIDLKNHCRDYSTTPRTRQRESDYHAKRNSKQERQAELKKWNLTTSKEAHKRGRA